MIGQNGNNGNGTNGNNQQNDVPANGSTPPQTNGKKVQPGLALFPFTPVPFVGRGAPWAWARLGIYSGLGAITWKTNKQLSYVLMGAAGVSLMTSMFQAAWNGGES